jgi:hypothetical protein
MGGAVVSVRRIALRCRDGFPHAFAVVDAADYARLSEFRWYLASNGYARRTSKADGQRKIYLHRAILGLEPGDKRQVDHINGDKLDNRRSNLRIATSMENAQNRRGGRGSSPHRGVSWSNTNNGWLAYSQVNGVRTHLGTFGSEEAAARAVDRHLASHAPFSPQARGEAA